MFATINHARLSWMSDAMLIPIASQDIATDPLVNARSNIAARVVSTITMSTALLTSPAHQAVVLRAKCVSQVISALRALT